MTTRPALPVPQAAKSLFRVLPISGIFRGLQIGLAGAALALLAGCETPPTPPPVRTAQGETGKAPEDDSTLKSGDVLKISFPGVPSMDTTQPIRANGRINLPMIGDIDAAGKNPDALTKELLDLYSTKLVSKEVQVALVSSAYSVYITGAVLRPGKVMVDRRISAFDAIMESGGFDKAKADLSSVLVIREENGQTRKYPLNLQKIMEGEQVAPFYLKPFDTVFIPEKFSWF